jgi:isopentenyl diphosphate isomerase/L-lactate dehydrogenase-like FMN-dependent dehydrogenase
MAANISQLKTLAKSRITGFVYDYFCGGCNEGLAVSNNRRALDSTYLQPTFLTPAGKADTSVEMLDQTYSSQFGVAPLGLSGLIWPCASTFQAKVAKCANQPFILSRVASISIEQAAASAEDRFWFQFYPPTDKDMLDAALPPVRRLPYIRERLGDQLPVIADSGVESSVDLARLLAQGANIVFAGGAVMYDVGALGKARAGHVFDILQTDLLQVLGQLRCPHPNLLKNFRIE